MGGDVERQASNNSNKCHKRQDSNHQNTNLLPQLPNEALRVINILEEAGFEAFAVGGAVRDFIRGIPIRDAPDIDIATSAPCEKAAELFEAAGIAVRPTGIKHGTITAISNWEAFEVTTFRVDGNYSDARHPDEVRFTRSIEEDLARRDFTINAMAYSPERGLIDPFGGKADLAAGRIRCVGDPQSRFKEDALRIMRAIRFAATLGFYVEPLTAIGMLESREQLSKIAAERVGMEFSKTMRGPYAGTAAGAFREIFEIWIPEITDIVGMDTRSPRHSYDVWDHSILALKAQKSNDLACRLATLFHDLGKAVVDDPSKKDRRFAGHAEASAQICIKALRRLKFPRKVIEQTAAIVRAHDYMIEPTKASVKTWMNKLGDEIFFKVLDLKRADICAHAPEVSKWASRIDEIAAVGSEVLKNNECRNLSGLAVTGKDLIDTGIPAGPKLKEALDWLLSEVINERCQNNKDSLIAHLSAFGTL